MPYAVLGSMGHMAQPKTKARTGKVARPGKRASLVTPRPDLAGAPLDRKTLPGRVRICREAKGITKADVARKLHVSQATVGDWENGDTRAPTAGNLLNMRDELGYNVDFIVRGTGMPLIPNFEEMAKETALMSIFRDLRPEHRESVLAIAQNLRRAQGAGPNAGDPFEKDPPNGDND